MTAFAFAFTLPVDGERSKSRTFKRVQHPTDLCGDVPCLWIDPQTQIIDLGTAGVVIGILFSRVSSVRLKHLPSNAPQFADAERLAAWLVCECWGAYVAILTGSEAGSAKVLVDPSGLFPAYFTRTAAHNLVVSQPELIEQVSGERPKPSWPDIQAHLGRSDLRQRSTCLERVREFGRGELTGLGESEVVGISLWSPATFMPDAKSKSCAEISEELQAITTMIVSAWADVLGPVSVAASGGVDSSMICAALAKTRKPFDCITLATADPSGDESVYVEMLSRHLGVRSEVRIYDIEHIDPLRCVSTGLARPTRKPFMSALDAALFEAGEALGSKVIFDGNGGDSLFCFLHSAAPIVDRLLSEGLQRGSASTFLDMCRLTGCDLPTMTHALLRRLVRKRAGIVWQPDLRLLAADTEDFKNIEPLSPWFNISVPRHPGKHDHLALILRNQNRLNGLPSLPRFSPLMSQPLVEYCLSVPTWLWCEGGINRAPARAAYEKDLPPEILMRTSKAGPDSFLWQIFDTFRPIYRELLLEGILAHEGLLDRAEVEQAIEVESTTASELIYRIFELVEAENWVRSWKL